MEQATLKDSSAEVDQSSPDFIDEDSLRAGTYSILSALLSQTPDQDLLDYLSHIEQSSGDHPGDMGEAWLELQSESRKYTIAELDDEYHALFIGLGRGEVVTYGSWHITGFLMEKPLSDLRQDLRLLGIQSDEKQKDPEDHISALCETMAILIQSQDIDETRQRQFFIRHIHPWAGKFFKQLAAAKSARYYKSVARLGQSFLQLENEYLNVQTH